MEEPYEFRLKNLKTRAPLNTARLVVALVTGFLFYVLVWGTIEDHDKLMLVGSLLVGFWIYFNLSFVKYDLQELFIPPFPRHAREIMVIGVALQVSGLVSMLLS